MGCIYSDQNKRSKNKKSTSIHETSGDTSKLSNCSGTNNSRGRRIFEACSVKEKMNGQIEITENELIFHFNDGKRLDWPLKFLRAYGTRNNLFSFECGRKCSTGPGIYVFSCPQAEQLLQTLTKQIGVMANNSCHHFNDFVHQMSHSQHVPNGFSLHEYQNAPNIFNSLCDNNSRPSSTMAHTYLNSTVIGQGLKSQPNYYTSNPLSNGSSKLNSSKHSLDETFNHSGTHGSITSFADRRSSANNGMDYRTLPSMKSENHLFHTYVNANVNHANITERLRRSSDSSDQHYYHNAKRLEQIQSKIDESDNLGAFCYVNFDHPNVIKNRKSSTFSTGSANSKNRLASRPTLETYAILELNYRTGTLPSDANTDSITATAITDNENDNNEQTNKNNGLISAVTKSQLRSILNQENSIAKIENSSSMMINNNPHNVYCEKENDRSNHKNVSTFKITGPATTANTSTTTSVPYAQIDFAKTMALSNSTANHRKL